MNIKAGQIIRRNSEGIIWCIGKNTISTIISHVSYKNKSRKVYKYLETQDQPILVSETPLTEDEVFEYMGRYNMEVDNADDTTQDKTE